MPSGLQRGTILVAGPCLLLEEAVPHLRWEILWPAGYSVHGRSIIDAGGHLVAAVGDVVDLGGGEYLPSHYGFLQTVLLTEPPIACRAVDFWLAASVTRR